MLNTNDSLLTSSTTPLPFFKIIKIYRVKNLIYSSCILPDKSVAIASEANIIIFYSPLYLTQKTIKTSHIGKIFYITTINDYIFTCSTDRTIKIFTKTQESLELYQTLQGHSDWVYKVIKIAETTIASCSRDLTIKIWDIHHSLCLKTLVGHKYYVNCLYKITNEDLFVSGSWDQNFTIWSSKSFSIENTISPVPCSWNESIIEAASGVVVVGGNQKISIIDIKTVQIIAQVFIEAMAVSLEMVNDFVYFGDNKGHVKRFCIKHLRVEELSKLHKGSIFSTKLVQGKILITTSEDNFIILENEIKQ